MTASLWAFVFVTCDSVGDGVSAGSTRLEGGQSSPAFISGCQEQTEKR